MVLVPWLKSAAEESFSSAAGLHFSRGKGRQNGEGGGLGRRNLRHFGRFTHSVYLRMQRSNTMARYGKAAAKSVKSALHREKKGTLRSGKGGKGGQVTSRKQAIAIGLSEARKKGAKVPKKK